MEEFAIPDGIVALCPDDRGEALSFFRAEGLSPIQACKAYGEKFGCHPGEGKKALCAHPAWRDVAELMDQIPDDIRAALEREDD